MRWTDIDLRGLHGDPEARRRLEAAARAQARVAAVQATDGLDGAAVVPAMAEAGHLLFQAVIVGDPAAFAPGRSDGAVDPEVGQPEADRAHGYHLIVPPTLLGLPWTWLHSGIGFLLGQHALAVGPGGSLPPDGPGAPPWTRRWREAGLAQGVRGDSLPALVNRLRPPECGEAEILFVPGHCECAIRRLIYREADGIRRALGAGCLGRPLAALRVLEETVTPGLLRRRGSVYQGLHFAGPTALPLETGGQPESFWLRELTDLPPPAAPAAPAAEPRDLDPVGIDPVTAALDEAVERAACGCEAALAEAARVARAPLEAVAAAGAAGAATAPGATGPAGPGAAWLLEGGAISPEDLGRGGGVPPLVFSNSHRSLPAMGPRFLASGASTFLGPLLPLYSRPARRYAGLFYSFLCDGHAAGSAHRMAALACREQLGPEHPAWLSYGLLGQGCLALQYL